jgi:hypothetical protein
MKIVPIIMQIIRTNTTIDKNVIIIENKSLLFVSPEK